MNKRRFPAVAGLSILVLALIVASPSWVSAVPSDKDVRVINSTLEPVPIVGTVTVSNANANTLQPFQASVNSTQTTPSNVSTATLATVPAGKRLVIEFVTMTAQVPQGQHAEIMEITTSTDPVGGVSHQLLIVPQPDAVIGDALFRSSQEVKLYANAGTQVQVLWRRNSNLGTATFSATLSGHLVDM